MDESLTEEGEIFIFVPQETTVSLQDLLLDRRGLVKRDLSSIGRRTVLYFDEQLALYIALRTSRPRHTLQDLTKRLSVFLDLRVNGSVSQSSPTEEAQDHQQSSQQDDIIWQGNLDTTSVPTILTERGDQHQATHEDLFVVWQCKVSLNRPQRKLQSPTISFNATAFLRPSESLATDGHVDPYMASGQPSPENLFAPLGRIKTPSGYALNLPSFRLNGARPISNDDAAGDVYLHVHVPEPLPVFPAILTRIRYLKSHRPVVETGLVVVLELEISPSTRTAVELSSVTMSFAEGIAEDLGKGMAPKLPHRCQPGDIIVYLFQVTLSAASSPIDGQSMIKALDIVIGAHLLGSDQCRPEILMHWQTAMDFSLDVNHAQSISQHSLQRHNRPAGLNLHHTDLRYGDTIDLSHYSGGDGLRNNRDKTDHIRLKVALNGPSKAFIHEEFGLQILISNITGLSRTLAIKSLRTGEFHKSEQSEDIDPVNATTLAQGNTRSNDTTDFRPDQPGVAEAETIDSPAILALTAAQQLGVVEQGACHSTTLRYLPLQTGDIQIGPIRIFDVEAGTHVDIHETPTILVDSRQG